MPDRIIRDELLDSDRWLSLRRNTHRLAYLCLLLRCDALGNMEATDGALWRAWRDPLALTDRAAIFDLLGALVDADLVRIYQAEGDAKRYAHLPRTRFPLRYVYRICPISPWTTDEQKQILEKFSRGARMVRTSSAPAKVSKGKLKHQRARKQTTVDNSPGKPLGDNSPETAKTERASSPWWKSQAGIVAKGAELGVATHAGEDWKAYKARLFDTIAERERNT